MKEIVFVGSSRDDVRHFPQGARREAGHQLFRLQSGLDPNDWKPMKTVGPGVREIRIHDDSGAFRVIYVASRGESIYVLHAFQKKSSATSQKDIELARRRFNQIS